MKFSTLLPLAAAIATAAMPPSVMAAGNSTLSVLTNNVYFLPSAVSNWAQSMNKPSFCVPEVNYEMELAH